GTLVDAVRGANAPELQRKIMSNLEQEKTILKEGGQRNEYRFEFDEDIDEDEDVDIKRNRSFSVVNAVTSHKYTVAVIRPDAVADGKTADITDKIKQQGFKVLHQEEKQLNEHDARNLYKHKMNEPIYEELIQLMCSGPCLVLVLQKFDAKESSVEDFRELLGPWDVEQARSTKPDSLRALFGTDGWRNAVDGSDSLDSAQRYGITTCKGLVLFWLETLL
ncbi:unnamed protein product, partial [Didymodactylos carnosus]